MAKENNVSKTLFDALRTLELSSVINDKKRNLVIDGSLAASLFAISRFNESDSSFAIVANNLYAAQNIYESLLNFLPESSLAFFPADELLRAEVLSSSKELMSQRLYAMGELRRGGKRILITHPAALLRYLPDPKFFDSRRIFIEKDASYDLEEIKKRLLEMGYKRVNKVDQSLQFAVRGDILDVFSVNNSAPVRIEFFGDQVERIKFFDIATQASKEELEKIDLLPASDLLLSSKESTRLRDEIEKILEKDSVNLSKQEKEMLYSNVESDLDDIGNGNYRTSLYKYMGFARENAFSILDYFEHDIVFVPDKDGFESNASTIFDEADSYLRELSSSRLAPSHLSEYISLSRIFEDEKKICYGTKFSKDVSDLYFKVRPIVKAGNGIAAIVPTIESYLKEGNKVVIALGKEHKKETVVGFLNDAKLSYEEVSGWSLPHDALGISDSFLNSGFEIPELHLVYLGSDDLFGASSSASRFSSRFKNATILKSYDDLRSGDYVVHEYNGIGRFVEVTTLENQGVHRDYLKIAYANEEILYVPLEQFRLVRKYSAREGAAPKLSHLFSGEWEKKKSRIKERINELADRLIALYGNRANSKGFAYPADDELQLRFENEFPYALTPDQQKAVDDIKDDMEKPEIMDRLLCGDVGFGKTEVAFRAAFKAICAGKQVALLCPTTLLARQHYAVAIERFATFGVRIGVLSRLVSEAKQKATIKELEDGQIDLIIGTHRLLSKDIRYKNLGLLIVDEEQRFGVEQKEKIKEIKQNVDVLTLSATPIPRTLQMSLVGIRPLSEINTAPDRRSPIQTYVTPYKESVVIELIQKELSRGGQVFYVYNRVMSIYAKGNELARAIPEAKIGIVHGKMEKDEIEDVMQRFYVGEINVLICTSIIENGIDVPNANMIIVEDADRFGLSQLYQIKGRVGRGNRIAYAYLMYRPQKDMNEDAKKRLTAIQEFTELGSGYKIAQRDLMIRGAGDILGPEQAGFIDSVGLDLYIKMLNEAIQNKKNNAESQSIVSKNALSIDAYIPNAYAIESDKIELYQELENAMNEKEVDDFEKRVRDIYGKLPNEVSLLIKKRRMDILLDGPAFGKMEEVGDGISFFASDSFSRINGIGLELFEALSPYLSSLKVNYIDKKLQIKVFKRGDWFSVLYEIVSIIDSLYKKHQTV